MEMVSASKMRKAQERMRAARPKRKDPQHHGQLSQANPEYSHPYVQNDGKSKVSGFIVVSTDKGLCGGLNTNILRSVTTKMKVVKDAGGSSQAVAIGNKGLSFMNRMSVPVVSHATQLGDAPHLEKLIGPVKVMLDAFVEGKVDVVYLCYTRFINTMKQEPVIEQLLPLTSDKLDKPPKRKSNGWDYLYEPDAPTVIDDLLNRYIEALVYQAVTENMASEQRARMVAMKAATDNAGSVIGELKLIYNKTRQAAITKEMSRSSAALPPSVVELPAARNHITDITSNLNELTGRTHEAQAQGKGKIVQCIGAVVDVEFPRDAMPQRVRRAEDGRLRR